MRDGTILRADVSRPNAPGQFPALLTCTPYNKSGGADLRFVRSGYVVVIQDCRGRYASDGEFQSFHAAHHREADDGYDSVEWLAAQPTGNGTVGLMGSSYPGWLAWEAAAPVGHRRMTRTRRESSETAPPATYGSPSCPGGRSPRSSRRP